VGLKEKPIENDVLYLHFRAVDQATRYITQKINNIKIYEFGVIFGPPPLGIFLTTPLPLA
jgi:hypothetical protein